MQTNLLYNENDHTYKVGGLPIKSVTDLLKQNNLYPIILGTDEHRWRGHAVHEMMNFFHKGTLDEKNLDPLLLPYLRGWRRFVGETGFRTLGYEIAFYHPVLHYGGRPDVWGTVGKEIWITDYKSGPVSRVTGLQLAGYQMLLIACGEIPEKGIPIRRIGIHLKNDGNYNLKPFDDDNDLNIWTMIISVHNWGLNNV